MTVLLNEVYSFLEVEYRGRKLRVFFFAYRKSWCPDIAVRKSLQTFYKLIKSKRNTSVDKCIHFSFTQENIIGE